MLDGLRRLGDVMDAVSVSAENRSGAVSMTGEGEAIIRTGLAKEICLLIEQGATPAQAGRAALRRMHRRMKGHAGAIILSRSGTFALFHTTPTMIAGYQAGKTGKVSGRSQLVK